MRFWKANIISGTPYPRIARINGKPNFFLYDSFKFLSVSVCLIEQLFNPEFFCSLFEIGVMVVLLSWLPDNSGWLQRSSSFVAVSAELTMSTISV